VLASGPEQPPPDADRVSPGRTARGDDLLGLLSRGRARHDGLVEPMNVIGLDLSLNGTGICVDDRRGVTVAGKASAGDMRLVTIRDTIYYYVQQARPALAVIEGLPFGETNSTTLALVHGNAREVLARTGVPFAYVYPTALKVFATDDASASKADMIAAAIAVGTDDTITGDEADAFWARRLGLVALSRHKAYFDLLGRVDWPPLSVVSPYGAVSARTPVTKKCGHKLYCLRNGDHWLHPFDVVRCEKPPK
jgi:Holliday junction resolvasome RuvABC endonuclease subunit